MKLKDRLDSKFLFIVLLLTIACSHAPAEPDPDKIERTIAQFHSQFKELKFREIYQEASPYLKSSIKEDEFIAKLLGVTLNTGKVHTAENISNYYPETSQTERYPEGRVETRTYRLEGTKGGCDELTHWLIQAGEMKLASFKCFPYAE
jgi:hypothetical protein